MKEFDHIKEPSIQEFYERCKNIEQEKKERSIAIERKRLIEKLGRNPTQKELDEHIKSVSKKIFDYLQSRIKKP